MPEDPQIRVIVGELEGVTSRVIKKLTLDATANLIEDTPVDTGWARANWVPSIGLPIVEGADASTREERQGGVSSRRAQQQTKVAEVATGYTLDRGSVFISNGVPYLVQLNEGTSKQAPAAFVQAAIARAVRSLGRGGL